MRASLALLAFLPTAFAHFVLNYPNSLGFNDDEEGEGPCGGFDVDFGGDGANRTNATIDGFAVALLTTHPQTEWLFRATVSTEAPYNWTNLLPVVSQTQMGNFCVEGLRTPSDFAGKEGLVQVVANAVDGLLYQCAIVNFVEGSNNTRGPTCNNASGLTATITNQANFSNASTSSSASPSATSQSAAVTLMENTGLLSIIFGVVGAIFML